MQMMVMMVTVDLQSAQYLCTSHAHEAVLLLNTQEKQKKTKGDKKNKIKYTPVKNNNPHPLTKELH